MLLHESLDAFPAVEEIPKGRTLHQRVIRFGSVKPLPPFICFVVHHRGKQLKTRAVLPTAFLLLGCWGLNPPQQRQGRIWGLSRLELGRDASFPQHLLRRPAHPQHELGGPGPGVHGRGLGAEASEGNAYTRVCLKVSGASRSHTDGDIRDLGSRIHTGKGGIDGVPSPGRGPDALGAQHCGLRGGAWPGDPLGRPDPGAAH